MKVMLGNEGIAIIYYYAKQEYTYFYVTTLELLHAMSQSISFDIRITY